MASRLCYTCGRTIPAAQYTQHRQAHANDAKPRHWTPQGEANRRKALKRDRNRCVVCGRTRQTLAALGLTLHVHHRDGNKHNVALSNLETRCEEHHPRGGDRAY